MCVFQGVAVDLSSVPFRSFQNAQRKHWGNQHSWNGFELIWSAGPFPNILFVWTVGLSADLSPNARDNFSLNLQPVRMIDKRTRNWNCAEKMQKKLWCCLLICDCKLIANTLWTIACFHKLTRINSSLHRLRRKNFKV